MEKRSSLMNQSRIGDQVGLSCQIHTNTLMLTLPIPSHTCTPEADSPGIAAGLATRLSDLSLTSGDDSTSRPESHAPRQHHKSCVYISRCLPPTPCCKCTVTTSRKSQIPSEACKIARLCTF